MSLAEHQGWIFSEGNPPKVHIGGLYPICGRGMVNPWCYLLDTKKWYIFREDQSMWFYIASDNDNYVPVEYRAQLLLIL